MNNINETLSDGRRRELFEKLSKCIKCWTPNNIQNASVMDGELCEDCKKIMQELFNGKE
jgi:Zn finger protein HypA/HybF involved in hydrogenase expression